MRNKRKQTGLGKMLIVLVMSWSVLFGNAGLSLQAQTNSVPSSSPSATPANKDAALRKACAETIDELKATRKLMEKMDIDAEKQKELLTLEKAITAKAKEIKDLDEQEKQELRNALSAANQAIAELRAANEELKKNQWTMKKALKAGAIGAAVGIIVLVVLGRN